MKHPYLYLAVAGLVGVSAMAASHGVCARARVQPNVETMLPGPAAQTIVDDAVRAIAVGPSPNAGAGENTVPDWELIKGRWRIAKAMEAAGAIKNVIGLEYRFDGKRLEIETPSQRGTPHTMIFDYELDAKQSPKRLTMTIHGEAGQKMQIRAIYELDGETLRICYYWSTGREKERPAPKVIAVDKTNKSSKVIELKRVKVAK